MTTGQTILNAAALVAAALLVGIGFRWLVRRIGCNCYNCGRRMATFDELDRDEQHQILRYFQEYEHRMPQTAAMFACRQCGFVHDDFSGEKASMTGNELSFCKVCGYRTVSYMFLCRLKGAIPRFKQKYSELIEEHECLRCQRQLTGPEDCAMCDREEKLFGCWRCCTLYKWKSVEGGHFKFMAPLTPETVLDRAPTSEPD